MTDKEWIANISNVSSEELFDELENIGCDGYYKERWDATIEELRKRVFEGDVNV